MRLLLLLLVLMPERALAGGWWCYAQSVNAERVLKWGPTLEESKNFARGQCNIEYGGGCAVIQCYEDSPYKYACVASRYKCETTIGGFRIYSNNEAAARRAVTTNCSKKWGSNNCVVACYANFTPPFEEADPEDLSNAAAFPKE